MEAACCSLENKTTPAKVPAVAGLGPAGAVNDLASSALHRAATLQPHQHGHSAPPSTGVGARFGQKCGAEQSAKPTPAEACLNKKQITEASPTIVEATAQLS